MFLQIGPSGRTMCWVSKTLGCLAIWDTAFLKALSGSFVPIAQNQVFCNR